MDSIFSGEVVRINTGSGSAPDCETLLRGEFALVPVDSISHGQNYLLTGVALNKIGLYVFEISFTFRSSSNRHLEQ